MMRVVVSFYIGKKKVVSFYILINIILKLLTKIYKLIYDKKLKTHLAISPLDFFLPKISFRFESE